MLVALKRLGSLGTSMRVSRSQKSFVERHLPRRMCPRVSLTPLSFHSVSFQTFQHLPLTFLLEFLCWPVIDRLVVLRALKHEDDIVRLLCFNV